MTETPLFSLGLQLLQDPLMRVLKSTKSHNSTGSMLIFSDKNIIRGKNLIEVDLQDLPSETYLYRMIGNELELFGRFALIKWFLVRMCA